ncbi:hypothetical protein [Acidaminobacter hydrogenoformans]|uniref:Uncharacterized protein n=1 Tax=Acidaminobacter hydrogenoformans DSM 2784 TaxID=1120920 RepID=A0A1G5S021_9FIRM|nr:hypothetical protein [Acidaminobacter hydrogenoformans]SCZ79724.1 hypothetical protein SAMN03080599_01918 [Acidaminobacter hydrogenoformans DSM 2784]
MKRNLWMDLTPLLDIFLILLFAVLINQNVGQRQLEGSYASAIDRLRAENTQRTLELEALKAELGAEPLGAADERVKYDFLVEKALVLDVELRGGRNQIWLNDVATSIYIVDFPERRALQKDAVQTLLNSELQRLADDDPLLLVTLKADTSAYRYAYLLVLEALREWTGENPLPKSYFVPLN